MKKTEQKGFSLIELMIVVAIIGIIAAIAIPSYNESTAKTRRGEAQSALMGLSSALERFYTQNNTYAGAATGGADDGAPAATLFPSQAPIDSSTKFYNLTIDHDPNGGGDDDYLLSATPIAGSLMASDKCGTFRISSTGAKTTSTGAANCWK